MTDSTSTYDELPYESHPYERTHPDHLASMAALFGASTPDPDSCRVLELGCAAGGNLIPQAMALPDSTFVGVDLSKRQIDEGLEQIKTLGLSNIELQHRSITDLSTEDGQFDYVLCHGVYSWVPRDVQDKIIDVCKNNMTPQGVAYISYNTYPGWFLRGMVRQMMCFHARQFDEPKKQVEQARALLDFLINAGPAGDPTYHSLLCRELEIVKNRHDSYLYHEHLEEENEPVFFYEFMERAHAADLRYLGEAQFGEMVPGNYSATAEQTMRDLGVGLVHSEQYLDFLRNRTFRRTLLCHESLELDRDLGPDRLRDFYVGCQLRPAESAVDLRSPNEVKFVTPHGQAVSVSQPLVKAALFGLGRRWPEFIPFDSLPALAHEELGSPMIRDAEHSARDQSDLGSLVLELYAADLIELRRAPPRFATQISDSPVASPLAILQAADRTYVTSQRHDVVQLTDLQRRLIQLADGSRTREQLCDEVEKLVNGGELVVERYNRPLAEGEQREFLTEILNQDLNNLMRSGLLVG